jgi:hypothetical protein
VISEKIRYSDKGWGDRVAAESFVPPQNPTISSYYLFKPSSVNDEIEATEKWTEAISKDIAIEVEGDYEITISFDWNISGTKYIFHADLLLDGDSDNPIVSISDKSKYVGSDASRFETKVSKQFLTEGDHNISLMFCSYNKKAIVKVNNILLNLKKVIG